MNIRIPDDYDDEVIILSWKKQPGDEVKSGEAVLEIEVGKAVKEVISEYTGILERICHDESEAVEPGTVVGIIG